MRGKPALAFPFGARAARADCGRTRAICTLTLLALAATGPSLALGRNRDKSGAGTIKRLEAPPVSIDTSAPLNGSQDKAIESYRAFLDLASEDPLLRAEAMRRIADLQLEAAEIEQLQSNVRSLAVSLNDTIELYRALLHSYPLYKKNDLVLYQLARAYEAGGRVDEALATLDRLVAEHPDTAHLDEAQFRRGETLFVAKRYGEAEAAYASIWQRGNASAFYEQALYKHGWSLFKQLRHEASLRSFFALLDHKLTPRATDAVGSGIPAAHNPAFMFSRMGRADQELVEDTLYVLAVSFSHLDGPDAIAEYFRSSGSRPYGYFVYLSLGDLYLADERYHDAADAYRAFVALEPYHAKAPLLQAEVIEAFEQGGFADLVLGGKREFVERYGPGSPYWALYGYDEQPDVVALLKSNLTDLAAHHHAQAQASGSPAEYAAAARWYRSYLQSFPEDEDAAGTNFLLAEVLYESGDYREAALEYERTAYAYPFHAAGGEAGYAALLAYAKHEETLARESRTVWREQSIESALRFAATYPEHEQAPAVQTDAAEKLFALGDFIRARDTALGVVERQPAVDAALVRTAWTVVAHAEFDLADYAAAENAYGRLMAYVPVGDAQLEAIVERIASSIYKQGELARDAGEPELAVEHFLRIGQSAPSSTVRATAEYDAAAVLLQAGDWPRATTVLEDFRARFPNHALAADATTKLAVAYVEAGDNTRAAREFERVAETDGAIEVKREALWRAAELYTESGQDAAAIAAFERYVQRHPYPVANAIEARQKLIEINTARGDHGARIQWQRDLVAADATAGAERTDRTRYLAANAQLGLAQPARDAFLGTRLTVPLERSLAAKRMLMEEALMAYRRAADYGVADVTTEATYEIAELYHALGRDLLASERPRELTPHELEQYEILLEEQAFPFEEEAIALHELNAARAADGIYDDWVSRSFGALARLVPVRYAKHEIGEDFVELTAEAPAAVSRAHERAVERMRAGDWIEAELELEQLVAEHPEHAAIFVNWGLLHARAERYEDARAALDQALAREPGHGAANNQLGIVLRHQGRFGDAERAYRRALESDPSYEVAHHNLGVLLDLYLRRQAEALEHYEHYQNALPAPDEAVARWIIDLRRRVGANGGGAKVARGNGR